MILKTIFNPLYFFQNHEQIPQKREKTSSHIYIDRIKYIKEQHKMEIQELSKKNESLNYDIEVLKIQQHLQAYKEVGEQRRGAKKEVSIKTIDSLKYLKKNTLEYVLGYGEDKKVRGFY